MRKNMRDFSMKFNRKSPEWTALAAAMCCGVVTHGFGLVTFLHNNDDIGQQPYGYGTGITSGRWLLTILGDFMQNNGFGYNLPLVNGLLFLALIAMSAAVAVSVLRVRSRCSAALMGMLFVVFPAVAGTMFFRYTVVYYGISLLLAVIAVWVLEKYRFGLIPAAVCMACSMGIYQAYIPMAIALFVLLLIRGILEEKLDFWAVVRRGLYYCGALVAGLAVYYLALKGCLWLYATELSDYNGVNSMGKLSLAALPGLVKEALYSPLMLPVKNYCALADMRWIRMSYLAIYGISAGLAAYLLIRRVKKPLMMVLTAVLFVLLLVAVNFIVIMCPDGWVYTLMVFPFVLLGCIPLVLWECVGEEDLLQRWAGGAVKKLIAAVLCLLVFCYGYDTNVNYTSSYFANRQTENYLNALVVQVRMTEGFDTEKEWAFLGQIEDPLLRTPWQYEVYFGGNEPAFMLVNRETRLYWVWHYFGYAIPVASEEKAEQLWSSEEVSRMPCWPDMGSIKAVGDTMVIKFQEYGQE